MVSLIRLYMRLAINGPVKIDDVVVFAGSVSLRW
jgi:ribosomal protein S28E/S33